MEHWNNWLTIWRKKLNYLTSYIIYKKREMRNEKMKKIKSFSKKKETQMTI